MTPPCPRCATLEHALVQLLDALRAAANGQPNQLTEAVAQAKAAVGR